MPRTGSGTLVVVMMALLLTGASAWLAFGSQEIACDRLPSLTILATLAAFVIALCFRLMARAAGPAQKWQLAAALVLSAATLFMNARIVMTHRGLCRQLQQQMQPFKK